MKTKLTFLALLIRFSVTAQTVEKLDLLPDYTAVYGSDMSLLRLNYNSKVSDFNTRFTDSCDLVTLNVSIPVKRLMKFYQIENAIPKSYIEVLYINMTAKQKLEFDTFVTENQ